MAGTASTTLTDSLTTLLPQPLIEAQARRLGVVVRQRLVGVTALVWTLVLGFPEGSHRSIAALRLAYEQATGQALAPSSFYARFTPQLVTLLRFLVEHALRTSAEVRTLPPRLLASFQEVLALDATVVRLHALLASAYPGTRTNHTQAAAKLHVVMNVLQGAPTQVKLTPERTHDLTPWKRVGRWVQGRLLLFDLGYFSYSLFDRIDRNGGYLLTRCKRHANPRIVAVHRRWRGRAIPLEWKTLQEVLPQLRREVLDVQVAVEFSRRRYRGVQSKAQHTFRLLALRNEETESYHLYLTNLPPAQLAAEEVRALYALRWQIELLFKSWKYCGRLEQLPSHNRAVIEAWFWASILAALASRTVHGVVRELVDPQRAIPLLRWAELFRRVALDLLRLLFQPMPGQEEHLRHLLIREAVDPNVHRQKRALGPTNP